VVEFFNPIGNRVCDGVGVEVDDEADLVSELRVEVGFHLGVHVPPSLRIVSELYFLAAGHDAIREGNKVISVAGSARLP
jgi:hypothetical protein